MSAINLKATPCFKGEKGDSAYDIAVQKGFVGSEEDWLATIGTSNHLDEFKTVHVTTELNEKTFELPEEYNPDNCYFSVYVNGFRISKNKYISNDTSVILNEGINEIGAEVEIVVYRLMTNNLPIVTEINENSTNDTAPSAKCLYDQIEELKQQYAQVMEKLNKLVTKDGE